MTRSVARPLRSLSFVAALLASSCGDPQPERVARIDEGRQVCVDDRCSFLEALNQSTTGSVVIELGATEIVRRTGDPIRIEGDVVIRGQGPTKSFISGDRRGQLFEVPRGSTLELRDLTVADGFRLPEDPSSRGVVRMRNVLATPAGDRIGVDLSPEQLLAFCLAGEIELGQYYRDATIGDPSALAAVPGEVF